MSQAWVYRYMDSDNVWTVGFYDPQGKWIPQSDHKSKTSAARSVHYLNGGTND